jgi:hypothetical protein
MQIGMGELSAQHQYQEYRRRLDARALLEHYGAENCIEQSGKNGTTEILHSCLLDRVEPHHSNGDRNPSACLNIDRKLYACYSGGWSGDLLHFVAKMEGKDSVFEVLPKVSEFLEGSVTEADDLVAKIQTLLTHTSAFELDMPTYGMQVLRPWAFLHPYLYEERGITVEAATKLHLGFDERENRIVFPHFWDGKLVGWQKRAIPARPGWPGSIPDFPKYRNNSGFPKTETLYRYNKSLREVIVVESPMSVAKAVSLGLDCVIATFGAKVTDRQVELLRRFDHVWVWFDDDTSGFKGCSKLVEGLWRHTAVDVVIPDHKRDLGDCESLDEVFGKLDTSVPAALWLGQYGRRSS